MTLESLLDDLDYSGGPYTGFKSPDVDLVLRRAGTVHVVEVTYRNEVPRHGYAEKLAWKTNQLTRRGIPCTVLRFETGQFGAVASDIASILRGLGANANNFDIQEFIRRYDGGRFTRHSFVEARSAVQKMGILIPADYRRRYSEDRCLPANPDDLYGGEGWLDWEDFLGVPQKEAHYAEYTQAQRAAQLHRFVGPADYRKRAKRLDSKLPWRPELVFAAVGWVDWDVYLGRPKKVGPKGRLLSMSKAAELLGVSAARVSNMRHEEPPLIPDHQEEGTRGNRYFYLESKVLAYKEMRGRRGKVTYEELARLCQAHGITNTNEYADQRLRSATDRELMPASPEKFFSEPDFDSCGGWLGLFGQVRHELPAKGMTPEQVATYTQRSKAAVSTWRRSEPSLQPFHEASYAPRGTPKVLYRKEDVDDFFRAKGWPAPQRRE